MLQQERVFVSLCWLRKCHLTRKRSTLYLGGTFCAVILCQQVCSDIFREEIIIIFVQHTLIHWKIVSESSVNIILNTCFMHLMSTWFISSQNWVYDSPTHRVTNWAMHQHCHGNNTSVRTLIEKCTSVAVQKINCACKHRPTHNHPHWCSHLDIQVGWQWESWHL